VLCLGMKNFLLIPTFFLVIFHSTLAQKDFRIHSHNDYLRDRPFWEALEAGAASIEVDVILTEEGLMVAHEKESIKRDRTLRSLYLEPISTAEKEGRITQFEFHLLIDCKTEAYATLEAIVEDASKFERLLFSSSNPGGLKLIVSGNRPKPEDYGKYPEWVFFDYQSKILTDDLPWEKIGMVSLSFSQFSTWRGVESLLDMDRERLEEFIGLVHSFRKPVRFWAAPDGKVAWKTFYDMGVDYINTDRPEDASSYARGVK
jgi:alkaline phosphatase